jgi:dipeptidyl aminopeptidase/acylaminoacyl peptidase
MPDYESVSFPSRDAQVTIQAWYIPVEDSAAPAVILVHGLDACRHSPTVLLPAGMLQRAGFHTLLIDLRNHGESDRLTGRMTGGIHEYSDVLGAWDWLLQSQDMDPARIGLYGTSLGAATVLIAAGEEAQIAAVWSDSSYADTARAIDDELRRLNYPTLLGPAGILMGRLIDGVDITLRTPMLSVPALANRPVYITHSEADTRMPVAHASILSEALNAAGNPVVPWIVSDSAHGQAIFDYPAEYEARLISFFSEHLRP